MFSRFNQRVKYLAENEVVNREVKQVKGGEKMKRLVLLIALSVTLLFIPVKHSMAESTATYYGEIDWDTFVYSGTSGLTIQENSQQNQIRHQAKAYNTSEDADFFMNWAANEWQTTRTSSGALGDSLGNVAWGETLSTSYYFANASAFANGTAGNYSYNSTAQRGVSLQISGTGTLTAEFDYSYAYFLNTTMADDFVNGQVWIQLSSSINGGDRDSITINPFIYQEIRTDSDSGTGTLSVSYEFTTSETKYVNLYASILTNASAESGTFSAPVPVPGAFLLLGSGMVGLLAIRRRN